MFNLQEAIEELGGIPGAICLPSGRHVIKEPSVLCPGQIIVGDNRTAHLHFLKSGITLRRNCSIRDCEVSGEGMGSGITVEQGSSHWTIDNVHVNGFAVNILIGYSWVGVLRDVISTNAEKGLAFARGKQTSTRMEGRCYFGSCRIGAEISGMTNMSLLVSAVFEANTECGLLVTGETRGLTIRGCHFECNGPAVNGGYEGPDLLLRGIQYGLGIVENAFFISKKNVVIESARAGEIARNYIGGAEPLTVGGAGSGLNIHDNDMPYRP